MTTTDTTEHAEPALSPTHHVHCMLSAGDFRRKYGLKGIGPTSIKLVTAAIFREFREPASTRSRMQEFLDRMLETQQAEYEFWCTMCEAFLIAHPRWAATSLTECEEILMSMHEQARRVLGIVFAIAALRAYEWDTKNDFGADYPEKLAVFVGWALAEYSLRVSDSPGFPTARISSGFFASLRKLIDIGKDGEWRTLVHSRVIMMVEPLVDLQTTVEEESEELIRSFLHRVFDTFSTAEQAKMIYGRLAS